MATVSNSLMRAWVRARCGSAVSPPPILSADATMSEPEHRVPFFVERLARGRKLVHLLVRREQLEVAEAPSARHRRRALSHGAVVEILIGLLVVLAARRHLPVDEEAGG